MKTITLSARFDGQHIQLEEDFPLPANARLLVTVLPDDPEAERSLRELWLQMSARSLEGSYGPAEPDYTLGMVREPNPKYESR